MSPAVSGNRVMANARMMILMYSYCDYLRISYYLRSLSLSFAATLLMLGGCSSEASNQHSTTSPVDFVMPVRGIQPSFLTPNFGAPRGSGQGTTRHPRVHEGLDIMAPKGRPVLACVSGVIEARKWNALGGNSIWLHGTDGRYYYYAHLSAYRSDLAKGDRVRAADVIGYVGNTGDAQGQATHLHFEIHDRRGGPAYDPYPILREDGVRVIP